MIKIGSNWFHPWQLPLQLKLNFRHWEWSSSSWKSGICSLFGFNPLIKRDFWSRPDFLSFWSFLHFQGALKSPFLWFWGRFSSVYSWSFLWLLSSTSNEPTNSQRFSTEGTKVKTLSLSINSWISLCSLTEMGIFSLKIPILCQ